MGRLPIQYTFPKKTSAMYFDTREFIVVTNLCDTEDLLGRSDHVKMKF